MKFTKKEQKIINRIEKNFKIMIENFSLSFETGSSIVGFILGQFVWVYILIGFLGWFLAWFCEVTNYKILDLYQLGNIFWIIYGVWFFISILLRLKIRYFYEAKK